MMKKKELGDLGKEAAESQAREAAKFLTSLRPAPKTPERQPSKAELNARYRYVKNPPQK